jgi:hypothetical protein
MFPALIDPETQQPRTPMFWVVLGGTVAVQLMVFWLLCLAQVEKAEARDFETRVQRIALSDCLKNIPGATLATCSGRADGLVQPDTGAITNVSMVAAPSVVATLR